jgi:hypothetical protein
MEVMVDWSGRYRWAFQRFTLFSLLQRQLRSTFIRKRFVDT